MTVKQTFENYPDNVKPRLIELRTLILQLASQLNLGEVEETLKWGEPSYNVKSGTPIRIDWKSKTPYNYFIFLNCQTKLIDTYKELYKDVFEFQGNRAIVLKLSESLPLEATKHCLQLGLTYQRIKHLPMLGT